MSVNRGFLGQTFGCHFDTTFPNTGTLALTAGAPGATWLAMSFVAQGQTLNEASIYCSAVSAAFASGADVRASLYSSNTDGTPNAEIEQRNCSATPAATQRLSWTGFSTALTNGTKYWIVWKNYHATSTCTLRWVVSSPFHIGGGTSVTGGWVKAHSTDSGGTWGTIVAAAMGLKLTYAGSIYDGSALDNTSASSGSTDGIYAAREAGSLFQWPQDARLRAVGLSMLFTTATGTPPDNVRFRLYEGSTTTPTLIATSTTWPRQSVTNGWYVLPLDATYQLKPAEYYRVVCGVVTGGDSSNYHRLHKYIVNDADSSRALVPLNAIRTYTTDGTTFANTNTEVIPFKIIADMSQEFVQASQSVFYKRANTCMRM